MQNNNPIYTIQDIYTSAPIEQSTDRLTNQTSFVVNFHNAYHMAKSCEVDSIANLKCRYCKAFYFPLVKQQNIFESNVESSRKSKMGNKGGLSEFKNDSKFICGLCGAINDIINDSSLSQLPTFEQMKKVEKSSQHQKKGIMKFNSSFQSLIINQRQKISVDTEKVNSKGDKPNHKQNSISFVFYIDLGSLSATIKQSVITYLKAVIREYFQRNFHKNSTNPQIDDNNQQETARKSKVIISQPYKLIIALNINDQLHLSDISTMSTINIDSILKQKTLSSIPTENSMEDLLRQQKKKQSLVNLINQYSVDLNEIESLDRIDEYFDLVLEDVSEDNGKKKRGFNGMMHYNILTQLLAIDKDTSRSYVMTYVGGSPLINYEPHRVKKFCIYSICYIFYQPYKQTYTQNTQPQSSPQFVTNFKHISSTKFQQSNLKYDILLIRDNNEVHFLSSEEKGLEEFYYRLYELFGIVEMPKLFRPRWIVRTDNKYPPTMSNELPSFFIKPTSVLLFLVSCLINVRSTQKNFQISVVYEDSYKGEKVWIINFTKDVFKQWNQLNQIYKMSNYELNKSNQAQPYSLLQKLPQIYNYIYLLGRFAMDVCILGKNYFAQGTLTGNKKSQFTFNSINSHQICVIFQSFINRGSFKMGVIQIGAEYIQNIYDYCTGVKNVSYQILKFFSSCQLNPRKAAQMIYPLLVRNHSEQTSSCIVYWGDGYYCLNDHSQDENSQDQDWYAYFIEAHNQTQAKHFTKRCYYQPNSYSDQNDLIKFYLKKLDLKEKTLSYLPLYFIPQNQ